jgi:hypothetical protein
MRGGACFEPTLPRSFPCDPMPPLDLAPGNDTWRVSLALDASRLRDFGGLLQAGVAVPVHAGCTVLRLLTHELGVHPRDVAARITTVFLDGKVVDALDTAVLRDGARLALSAALPGLVGATMRRDGPYAAMRAEITRAADAARPPVEAGASGIVHVTVKLFNLLIEELGPALLARGIVLDARTASDLLRSWRDGGGLLRPDSAVFLRVTFSRVLT